MRFGFLFHEVFWGVFLIILGISMVIKVLFHLNIPLFRVALAFLLIYAGISALMGGFAAKPQPANDIFFNDSRIHVVEPQAKYNIFFGKGTIDLSDANLTDTPIEINTIFGAGIIKINPNLPVKVNLDAAFAGARTPDGNTISFGNYSYHSPKYKAGERHLEINAHVVFGGLELVTD